MAKVNGSDEVVGEVSMTLSSLSEYVTDIDLTMKNNKLFEDMKGSLSLGIKTYAVEDPREALGTFSLSSLYEHCSTDICYAMMLTCYSWCREGFRVDCR
jgi:hypothetical protein